MLPNPQPPLSLHPTPPSPAPPQQFDQRPVATQLTLQRRESSDTPQGQKLMAEVQRVRAGPEDAAVVA